MNLRFLYTRLDSSLNPQLKPLYSSTLSLCDVKLGVGTHRLMGMVVS